MRWVIVDGKRRQTPEYTCWKNMRARCFNPNGTGYADYGARGISVHPSWADFEQFLSDMGPRPSAQHSIERRNTNQDYSPDNCFWGRTELQSRNRRSNRFVTFGGERMLLVDALHKAGLHVATYRSRLRRGWSQERALNTPRTRGGGHGSVLTVIFNGKRLTIAEASRRSGKTPQTIYRHLHAGRRIERLPL